MRPGSILRYPAGLYKEELLYLAEKINAKINVLHVASGYELNQEKKTNKSILTGKHGLRSTIFHTYLQFVLPFLIKEIG